MRMLWGCAPASSCQFPHGYVTCTPPVLAITWHSLGLFVESEVMSRLLVVPAKGTASARRGKSQCVVSGNRLRYSHSIKFAHVKILCRFQQIPFLLLQNTNALHALSAQTPLGCNSFHSQCLMAWCKITLVSSLRNALVFNDLPSMFATVQVSNIRSFRITTMRDILTLPHDVCKHVNSCSPQRS